MPHLIESRLTSDVAAPASKVWDLIADFGALEKWWPPGMLEKVVCEGEGVGMIRYLHISPEMVLQEKLDVLDPNERRLELSIDGDMPIGIKNYTAIGKVVETGPSTCQLVWAGRYQVPGPDDEAAARGFIEGAYAAQAEGVKAYVEK